MSNRLLIISASPMNMVNGNAIAFEPTLREIEKLTLIFDDIKWIGVKDESITLNNSRLKSTNQLRMVVLPKLGGEGVLNRLKSLIFFPFLLIYLFFNILIYKNIHTRAPSYPAYIGIIFSFIFTRKVFWHKYAGNWIQENPPRFYAMQRRLLMKNKTSKVTVNGQWENMPPQILAFENPCFSEKELNDAHQMTAQKKFDGKINLLFVGRLEEEKGIGKIIRSIQFLTELEQNQIEKLTIVGIGRDQEKLMKEAKDQLKIPFEFLGSLKREELNRVYSSAHVFLLPSASEGFPKVISEAAAFNMALLVSNVSSISQYVHQQKHGFVMDDSNPKEIAKHLSILIQNRALLEQFANSATEIPKLFTYERYNDRLVNEVFCELKN